MSSTVRFRVAICGAGIGGLTCAVALSKYPDIQVDVYEAATKFGEIGAGVAVFPRPWKILRTLGLEDDLLKVSSVKPKDGLAPMFWFRKGDQAEGLDFFTLMGDGTLVPLHRADFHEVLLRHLPETCRTHTSKRLRSYTQHSSPGSPIELHFADGSSSQCDVLIGADGLKSAVRHSLCTEKAAQAERDGRPEDAAEARSAVDPLWSGMTVYRALIPAEKLNARAPGHQVLETPTQYVGKGGNVVAYPIQHGKMINFAAFTARHDMENTKFDGPWSAVIDKSAFASNFSAWEPDVQALLDCVDKPLLWAIHTVKPMGSFVSGRVALIGDAAHAMCPYQASGAGQAIEDAYILASVLGHPRTTLETLPHALHIYDEVRRPFALEIQAKSRRDGQYFSLHVEGMSFDAGADGADESQLWENLQDLGRRIAEDFQWSFTTTIDGMLDDAIRMIEA